MARLKSWTKEQKKVLSSAWEDYEAVYNEFHEELGRLEKRMANFTGVEDVSFFHSYGEGIVGIGNDRRTYKLWQKKQRI